MFYTIKLIKHTPESIFENLESRYNLRTIIPTIKPESLEWFKTADVKWF